MLLCSDEIVTSDEHDHAAADAAQHAASSACTRSATAANASSEDEADASTHAMFACTSVEWRRSSKGTADAKLGAPVPADTTAGGAPSSAAGGDKSADSSR